MELLKRSRRRREKPLMDNCGRTAWLGVVNLAVPGGYGWSFGSMVGRCLEMKGENSSVLSHFFSHFVSSSFTLVFSADECHTRFAEPSGDESADRACATAPLSPWRRAVTLQPQSPNSTPFNGTTPQSGIPLQTPQSRIPLQTHHNREYRTIFDTPQSGIPLQAPQSIPLHSTSSTRVLCSRQRGIVECQDAIPLGKPPSKLPGQVSYCTYPV